MSKKNCVLTRKTLTLRKNTISNLDCSEMSNVNAGAADEEAPCWENWWTYYHCECMYTGDPQTEP